MTFHAFSSLIPVRKRPQENREPCFSPWILKARLQARPSQGSHLTLSQTQGARSHPCPAGPFPRQRFGPAVNIFPSSPPAGIQLFNQHSKVPSMLGLRMVQQRRPGVGGGGRRAGSLVAGKDSRLIAGVLVEAAGEDEFAQHVLLQRGRGVLFPSGQNVDVVEAVPLPHSIHP